MCKRSIPGSFEKILLLILFIAISGCATAGKINRLGWGMTKQEVVEIMGTPESTSVSGKGNEVLRYDLYGNGLWPEPHYVILKEGRVDSFGHAKSFMTTDQQFQYDRAQAAKANNFADGLNDFSNSLKPQKHSISNDGFNNSFPKAERGISSEGFGPQQVRYCKAGDSGLVGMCFMSLGDCRRSLSRGETCIAR